MIHRIIPLTLIGALLLAAGAFASGLSISMTAQAGPAKNEIPVAANQLSVNNNGQCSLNEAIENANDGGQTHDDCAAGVDGPDQITLANASSYGATTPYADSFCFKDDNLTPIVTSEIVIEGNGSTVAPTGNEDIRVFCVMFGGDLTLNDVTVSGGGAFIGGGIVVGGGTGSGAGQVAGGVGAGSHLTLNNAVVSGNSAFGGGGIFVDGGLDDTDVGGTLSADDSFISFNGAVEGGGVYLQGGLFGDA
jgi:hypothetical protein